MKIRRYEMKMMQSAVAMQPWPDGEWVKYADHAEAVRESRGDNLRELLALMFYYGYTPADEVPKRWKDHALYPRGGSRKLLIAEVRSALSGDKGE